MVRFPYFTRRRDKIPPPVRSHVVLVAFDMNPTAGRPEAMHMLVAALLAPGSMLDPNGDNPAVESWHIAEDDCPPGLHSDSMSAVFCNIGSQHQAAALLAREGLA